MEQDLCSNLTINLANYILENHTTIRATAYAFNIPKSTVHHYLSVNLKHINLALYKQVQALMKENFSVKHLHGGESTKHKYERLKNLVSAYDEAEITLNTN